MLAKAVKDFKFDIDKMELAFKVLYLFHIILCSNVYYVDTVLNTISSALVLISGGLILLYRVVNFKKFINYPYFWLYMAFIVSYFVSALAHFEYGLFSNIKILIWTAFFFFILYIFDKDKSPETIKRELYVLGNEICIIAGATSAINVLMLFTNYITFHETPSGKIFLVGIAYWGRLYGTVTDPNYAAVVSVVAIMLAIGFLMKSKKTSIRVLYIICIVLNLCSIVFSASRTGLVTMSVSAVAFAFIYGMIEKKGIIKSIIIGVVAFVLVLAANKAVLFSYNTYVDIKLSLIQSGQLEDNEDVELDETIVEIGREEELEGDVSNRRFDLWKNAAQIFAKNPILGVSFAAYVPYCQEELPDAYMINNDSGVVFEAFHNMLMDLMASQGAIGIVLFVIIIILSLRYIWLHTRNMRQEDAKVCALLFSICLGIVVSSMFVSEILYVHTQTTVVFWVLWGYLICLCVKNNNGDMNYEH